MTLKAKGGALVVNFMAGGAMVKIYGGKTMSEDIFFTYPKLIRACKDVVQGALRYAVDHPH